MNSVGPSTSAYIPNNEQSLFFSIPSINDTKTTNREVGKL